MHMKRWPMLMAAMVLALAAGTMVGADGPAGLRLVPFPKEVKLADGEFALDRPLVLEVGGESAETLAGMVSQELTRAGLRTPRVVRTGRDGRVVLRAETKAATTAKAAMPPEIALPATAPAASKEAAREEGYSLVISPDEVVVAATGRGGLVYGTATLCQLIRANRRNGTGLPCLAVRDWPSLRWRAFQDDLTRGPSTKLDVLKRQMAMAAGLKLNLFTYYMEYQYAWAKHPLLGPKDGSLTPEELKALVAFGRPMAMDVLGNQQSFGHFGAILKHEQYAALRETADVLCPTNDASYALLDDLYSEQVPLLPLGFFNVCCDETWGLGTGPSKDLAGKIGVGGVYARHLRRVHDLLKDKYGKRMMMWGDIILQHPQNLKDIPSDTIMLTWGYGDNASFDTQIVPFVKSGYEFFVCPGVSNWNHILPDFATATVNIRNFVRDGARHGAIGMLNTAWDDDGENFNAPSWHGYAWGAECAWNASATDPADFNRRLGAVMFGEGGDHFGQAIELLAKTHRLNGMFGMGNGRFWRLELGDLPATAGAVRQSARRLLELTGPAIEHLLACQKDATVNADLIDFFLFGARRMELIARRSLDTLDAAGAYRDACELPANQAAGKVAAAAATFRKLGDQHEAMGKQFAALWERENKPYALDWTIRRYDAAVKTYNNLSVRLAAAAAAAEAGKPLPSPRELGLDILTLGTRRTLADRVAATPLDPQAPWADPSATHRLGIEVDAGSAERENLPIELDLRLPDGLETKNVSAFRVLEGGRTQELHAQLDPTVSAATTAPATQQAPPGLCRLTVLLDGTLAKGSRATVAVYLGLPGPRPPLAGAVSTRDAAKGMKWLENDKLRLLLGGEGAHLYRWEVKAADSRDLTMPGETSWYGFADLGGERRSAVSTLVCTARGPAMVRYVCTDPLGTVKTVSLPAGAAWAEVTLEEGVSYFWALDDPTNFAADGPTPGRYVFSSGVAGNVGRQADGTSAQVSVPAAHWSVKFVPGKLALGLATPEVAARHVIAPGGSAGGVGIEGGPPASHFVLYGGPLPGDPAALLARLAATLDFRNQPAVTRHALQARPPQSR
jgi:hypothetical protein